MRERITRALPSIAVLVASMPFLHGQEQAIQVEADSTSHYEILVRGGRVYDGSGNPWVQADIGVQNGRIAAVGFLPDATADRIVDAQGLVVMPGIIDMHSHANSGFDRNDPRSRATINNLTQGITTIVVGESGSAWRRGTTIQELTQRWTNAGIGTNVALLAGIETIRGAVLPSNDATPTAEQIAQMQQITREAMEGGAFGISSALDYWNGHFSSTEEIKALAEVIAPYNGIYSSHIRSEGTRSLWWVESDSSPRVTHFDAIREIIDIGRSAGIRVHILHIKSTGVPFWGQSDESTRIIEEARAAGVDVTANVYPYTASGPDRNTQLFKWEPYLDEFGGQNLRGAGRKSAIAEELEQDEAFALRLEKDVAHEILARGGADRMLITGFPPNPVYVGKFMSEVNELRQESMFETAKFLQLDNGARIRSYSMQEDDLKHYLTRDYIAPATDGSASGTRVHPRAYGTFPRFIRKYVLDEQVITMPFFVRKVTALPASIMGFKDRGLIKEGFKADILVFDQTTIRDNATFEKPNVYSDGVRFLLINGQLVLDDGQTTGALAGEVILRK